MHFGHVEFAGFVVVDVEEKFVEFVNFDDSVVVRAGAVVAFVLTLVSSGHFLPMKNEFGEQKQAKCGPFSFGLKVVDISEHLAFFGPQIPARLQIPIWKKK